MDTRSSPLSEAEEDTEIPALAAAVAESDADPRVVSHEDVRLWLLGLASGTFDVPPSEARVSHSSQDLRAGYAAMAADDAREAEAQAWSEAFFGDIADEPDCEP
jgi:hypothetical protein